VRRAGARHSNVDHLVGHSEGICHLYLDAAALLTSRWLVEGSGQGAADLAPAGGDGGRDFTHRKLPPGQG
jgi:hypothetical protein